MQRPLKQIAVAARAEESTQTPARTQHTTRTVLIHQAFAGPQEAGGTRHYEFAKRLTAQGHSFAIVASDLSYLTGGRVGRKGFVTHESLDGIDLLRAYTYKSLHRSFGWRIVSFLSFAFTSIIAAMRAGRADVVMGTTPSIFQAVSASVVALCRRKPLLLEVRDLWPSFAIDMGVLKNPMLIVLSRWLESTLYRLSTHILVNSPAYRDYLVEKGVQANKITVIANGVDPTMFRPEARGDVVRKRYGLEGKFVVTYAGALGLANDIDTLLRAAGRLRDDSTIHFLLLGDGKQRPHLEAMAQSMGLTNVTFAGAQPKDQVGEFLAASDACVAILQNIPMFRTTYPNKVFDYMAAGRPTILAIDGVIREVIERAEGGVFVPPGNDAELASAVARLSSDLEASRQMGAKARTYVVQNFNREKQAQAFSQLIIAIATKRASGRAGAAVPTAVTAD